VFFFPPFVHKINLIVFIWLFLFHFYFLEDEDAKICYFNAEDGKNFFYEPDEG